MYGKFFKKRKDEQLLVANQPGTLTFITMGMDFPPKIEGGLGNCRIRAKFLDKNGHEWFIEIHPHYLCGCLGYANIQVVLSLFST